MTFHVYALVDPATPSEVRYIGYTRQVLGRRLSRHLRSNGRTHKDNWIRSLLSAGRRPTITELASGATMSEALELERHYIALYRASGARLTNATEGGEGHLGYSPSAETREKLRRSSTGRRHSMQTRLKMSANNGMKLASVRERVSKSLQGRVVSDDTRAKQSAVRTGRVISESWRSKLSASVKSASAGPSARGRLSRSGSIGNHNRWHLAKGVKKPGCALCK